MLCHVSFKFKYKSLRFIHRTIILMKSNPQNCIILILEGASSWCEPTQATLRKVGNRERRPQTQSWLKKHSGAQDSQLSAGTHKQAGGHPTARSGVCPGLKNARFLLPLAVGTTCQAPARGGLWGNPFPFHEPTAPTYSEQVTPPPN